MGNSEWVQRLTDALKKYAGGSVCQDVMVDSDQLLSMDEKQKAEWVCRAMEKLDYHIADNDKRIKIMTECSCRCYGEFIEEFKQEYQASRDIDRLIDLMYGKVFLNRPVREGNIVYVTKAPRFPGKHAKAKTPEERQYYFCHCDFARAAEGEISPTYCLCGAGWCKQIWEQVLERPVRVDVVQSVLLGDDICQFAVYL
ncbi:MAG: DUF6144 family protein [Candidatus Zixiibacteriota bacterium]